MGFFKKEAGREADDIDEMKTKYYLSNRRDLGSINEFVK
jgi:hypothetical protein